MCEIFGITILNGKHKKALDKSQLITLFNNLALKATNKSHTSTGLIIANDTKFSILRKDIPIEQLVAKQVYLDFMNRIEENSTYSIFGYNANRTTEKIRNIDECYPLVEGTTIGLVEGMVTGVQDRFKNFQKNTETSGEYVPKLFNYFKNTYNSASNLTLKRLFEKVDGNVNAVLLNTISPSSVHILKTTDNPFSMFIFKEHGLILYATLKNFVNDAARLTNLEGTGEQILLTKRTGVTICAQSNSYEKFTL